MECAFEILREMYFNKRTKMLTEKEKEEVNYEIERDLEEFFTAAFKLHRDYFSFYKFDVKDWTKYDFKELKKIVLTDYAKRINNQNV